MIQVLGRAIKIINIIADAPTAVSLKTISEKTKLNKSTCHHILETLIDNELIIKISASKGYILGPATFYWTRHGRFNNDFIILCDPVLKWLNKKINQTIILATIIKGNKYIIDYCESDVQLSKTKVQLLKDDIYRTATGRLLLANLDKDQIYEVYKKFGLPNEKDWPKIDSFEILLKNLAMIKNQKI
jgi:IclR family acetate operon transcriptional repressor